jgi:hypothetical protein
MERMKAELRIKKLWNRAATRFAHGGEVGKKAEGKIKDVKLRHVPGRDDS